MSARKKKHLTQERLSELLDITPEHLSRMERGITNIRLEMIVRISDKLSVEPEHLLFGTVSSSKLYKIPELNEYLENYSMEEMNAIVQIAKIISELK